MNAGAIESLSGLFGSNTRGGGAPGGTEPFPGNMGLLPGQGANQFGSYPSNAPGIVPLSSPTSLAPPSYTFTSGGHIPTTKDPMVPTYDPSFTNQFYQMLMSQLGQGVTPFNLSASLPSGGSTQPGQLSAPMNITLQDLQSFLAGGSTNIPGANQLQQMAKTGDPISATPEWQAMLAAQQQNIQQNEANLKEQFAFGGALGGSEFGTAMANFGEQTTKDQNALLAQLQTSASENAMNRMLSAGQGIQGEAQQFGSEVQSLDQSSIDRMLQEFIRTQPQYNPLLSLMGQSAFAAPGQATPKPSMADTIAKILGGIGSII